MTPDDGPHTDLVEAPVLERVLSEALRRGGDFAEIFAEDRSSSSIFLDDRRVEELSSGRDRGAGIRVVAGETTGFAHTADLSEDGLLSAARAARAIAREGGGGVRKAALSRQASEHQQIRTPPNSVPKSAKVELLLLADDASRSAGRAIVQVSAGYGDSRRRILVANSDGRLADDDRVRTRLFVTCVASGDGGLQTGSHSSRTPSVTGCSTTTLWRKSLHKRLGGPSSSFKRARPRRASCPWS